MKRKDGDSELVTKGFLEEKLDVLKGELRGEIKLSADETVRKLEETIIGVKDILLTTMDSFAKDIENNREDRELAVHQTSQLNDRVENHEERIKILEKIPQTV